MSPDHEPELLKEQPMPYTPPPETRQLIDELYREELREARAMAPEQKLLLGEELFDYACSITLAGIRNQFPEADEAERRRILENTVTYRQVIQFGAKALIGIGELVTHRGEVAPGKCAAGRK